MSVGLSRPLFNPGPYVEKMGIALTLVVKVIGAICVQEHAIGIILSLCQRKRQLENFALQYFETLLPSPSLRERRGPTKLQIGLGSDVGRFRRTMKSTGGL